MRILLISLFIVVLGVGTSCKRKPNNSSSYNSKPKSQKSTKAEKGNNTPSEKKSNSASSAQAEKVIKEARSFTGTHYKYGGTTKAGIDCSGLTCQAYKAVGVTLPRTASDQCSFGKKVSNNDLQKGDLVFFTDRKGNSKITHVGMVTEVKGPDQVRFIHASTKMGVIEADLFSDYYKGIFLRAVRVF